MQEVLQVGGASGGGGARCWRRSQTEQTVCLSPSSCAEGEVLVRNCTPTSNSECKKVQPPKLDSSSTGVSSAGGGAKSLCSLLILDVYCCLFLPEGTIVIITFLAVVFIALVIGVCVWLRYRKTGGRSLAAYYVVADPTTLTSQDLSLHRSKSLMCCVTTLR